MYANVIIACKRKLSAVSNFDSFLNGFYNFRLKIKITQSKVLKQANKFDVMVSVVDSYQNWLLFMFKLNHKQNHINVKMNTQKNQQQQQQLLNSICRIVCINFELLNRVCVCVCVPMVLTFFVVKSVYTYFRVEQ